MLGFSKLKGRLGLKQPMRKSQLGLFGPRAGVQAPGSRGGKYYVTDGGKVMYGTAPTPDHKEYGSQDQAEAAVAHRGASASKHGSTFRLAPPELGETRSGKPVPHPDDDNAYHAFGGQVPTKRQIKSGAFKGWDAADHGDAGEMHDKYARYFAQRGRDHLAASHESAGDEHRRAVKVMAHAEEMRARPGGKFPDPQDFATWKGGVPRRRGDGRSPEQLAEDSKYAWQYTMGAKTRSGKAIPDVDDEKAYQRVSQQGGGERRHLGADAHAPGGPMHGWSADDHRDAADYYQDFGNRGGQTQRHREASHAHLGEARILDQVARPLSPEQHADEWKKHEAAGDAASANAAQAAAVRKHGHLARVPAGVQNTLRTHLGALRGHADALESGRQTDRMFGGGGRYEHDAWQNRGLSEERLKTHHDAIAAFRTHAPKQGVDPDAVLSALGGVPEVKLSEKAAAHRKLSGRS